MHVKQLIHLPSDRIRLNFENWSTRTTILLILRSLVKDAFQKWHVSSERTIVLSPDMNNDTPINLNNAHSGINSTLAISSHFLRSFYSLWAVKPYPYRPYQKYQLCREHYIAQPAQRAKFFPNRTSNMSSNTLILFDIFSVLALSRLIFQVIGDKKGGRTSLLINRDPSSIKQLKEIAKNF